MTKQYPKSNGPDDKRGFTFEEMQRGEHTLYQDYTCPKCAKVQPVAALGHVGGPCVRCGYSQIKDMENL